MAEISSDGAIERIHCNECRQKTRHELLCKVLDKNSEDHGEEGGLVEWTITSEMFRCCGCRATVLRRSTVADVEPEFTVIRYFPPTVSRHPPSWQVMWTFPENLREVMKEIYRSLDANNHRLPMMGARTLIDMLAVDKVGDVGTFDHKLKQLEGLGVISSHNREILSAALDIGNAAAHRGHAPKAAEVNAVMDIVENLLHSVYVLPDMAERLKKTTPTRPSNKTVKESRSANTS